MNIFYHYRKIKAGKDIFDKMSSVGMFSEMEHACSSGS